MEQITPHLFIGSREDAGKAEKLTSLGITAVLKLTHEDPPTPYPDSLSVADRPLIDGPQNDFEKFQMAVDRLVTFLEAGETVLVHCSAGTSRSGAVAAASLAKYNDVDVDTALARIQTAKPDVKPHPALLEHARRS